MKPSKSLLVLTLALFGSASLMAQTVEPKYEFRKHAFLDLQGGVQHTLGEGKFGDLISPNAQIGLGYQFCRFLGVRFAVNAWQSKGGWSGYKLTTTSNPETMIYKYKYVSPTIDVMFNLSNMFAGYNPTRFFNVTAFVGGGANLAFSNGEANDLAVKGYDFRYIWDGTKTRLIGRGGLDLGFRISDRVAFTIEANANILNDHYNSKKAGNPDWYFNALAGFRINLGKTYKVIEPVVAPAPEPVPVVEEKKEEPTPVPTPTPVPVEVKKEPMRRDVFFKINSAKIDMVEVSKIKDIADFLNSHQDAKVVITGYADAGTGTESVNDRIAAKRAESVVKVLLNQYNISSDRITYDSKGSRVQPFSENDKNRVSIFVAE